MSAIDRSARVGLITDQSGALSFMGITNVNVATMVVDDINAGGGLLGPAVVEEAMGIQALALLATLNAECASVDSLAEAASEAFRQHPDTRS